MLITVIFYDYAIIHHQAKVFHQYYIGRRVSGWVCAVAAIRKRQKKEEV